MQVILVAALVGYHLTYISWLLLLLIDVNFISDEGWETRLFPPRCFVPSQSPRSRVPGIVFLDERA